MKPDKIEIWQGKSDKWYWRRRASNGKIVTAGGQGFASKWNAQRAARRAAKDITTFRFWKIGV